MKSRMFKYPLLLSAIAMSLSACDNDVTEVGKGFAALSTVRPALTNSGTVVAATSSALVIADGTLTTTINLNLLNLSISDISRGKAVQARDEGELIFVANHDGATPSGCLTRGVYSTTLSGGPVTTVHETCPIGPGPNLRSNIAMSSNGTVAFSDLSEGFGAIYRYSPGASPAVLRSGTGEFFNMGQLDINNGGQVPVQFEYFDGFAGGLMRGILVFETPEQAKLNTLTAVEKLNIAQQPPLAINTMGTVAMSINSTMNILIGGVVHTYEPGVYFAEPTLFNSPKMLTLVAGVTGAYCGFGNVDINDDGVVVFEAGLDAESNCEQALRYDGLFSGSDSDADGIATFRDTKLGDHRFFDRIILGEINQSGQISFITTSSAMDTDPVKVWRYDPPAS